MPYNLQFYSDLKEINDLLVAQNTSLALQKFKIYLPSLRTLGNYGLDWQENWRQEVFRFGKQFLQTNFDAKPFLDEINEAAKAYSLNNIEILDFIFSEIIWNFYEPGNEYVGPQLRELIKKYPQNPEFHNTYALFLISNFNYEKAISEGRVSYKLEHNNRFHTNCFNYEKQYFDFLINQGNIDGAERILNKMREILTEEHWVFNNVWTGIRDRLTDHKLIAKKIDGINELIFKATEKERNKLIEILGIFVAILSFIFINVNIALHGFVLKDIFILMMGMAIVLMLFATFTSFLVSRNKKVNFWSFIKSYRFWIVIVLISLLFLIFHFLV